MFALTQIHQIEMTSRCNLRCRYCPSPKLARPKIDMDAPTFERALHWVRRFSALGTQGELNLAGIGESTLHPEFVRNVHLAREALHPTQRLVMATNGLLMTDALAQAIAPTGIAVWVSLHRPEKAGPAVEALKRAGILAGVSADPSVAATDWAGQVAWHNSASGGPCHWVRDGYGFVMADGRVSRCSLDASGIGVFAHIDDDLMQARTSPYALCRTCIMDVGVPMDAPRRAVNE